MTLGVELATSGLYSINRWRWLHQQQYVFYQQKGKQTMLLNLFYNAIASKKEISFDVFLWFVLFIWSTFSWSMLFELHEILLNMVVFLLASRSTKRVTELCYNNISEILLCPGPFCFSLTTRIGSTGGWSANISSTVSRCSAYCDSAR